MTIKYRFKKKYSCVNAAKYSDFIENSGNDLGLNWHKTTDVIFLIPLHECASLTTMDNKTIFSHYFAENVLAKYSAHNSPTGAGKQLSNQFLGGMMDEVRIWNIALTPSQIQNNYNYALINNETGLVALYHFNQNYDGVNNAGETTLLDATANNNDGTLMDFTLNGSTSNWLQPGAISDAPCLCTQFITVGPGNYNDPATWGGCMPPNPIPQGVSITITYPVTNPVGNTLINNGQIDFGPGGTLINEGVYTGTGTFTGTLINLGEVRPGN